MRDLSPGMKTLNKGLLPLLIVAATVTLNGCSTQPPAPTASELAQAQSADRLQDIRNLLIAGEFDEARQGLQATQPTRLSGRQRVEWHLLAAELLIEQGDMEGAANQLASFDRYAASATTTQENRAGLLRIRMLELSEHWLQAARERDFISAVLNEDRADENLAQLWQDLLRVPDTSLQEAAANAPATRFGAWLTLAAISRSYHLTLDEQVAAVDDWRTLNPGHPAAMQLPGTLSQLESIASQRPERISVLLPLSGRLQRSGQAILDGFMAAYYQSLTRGFPVPVIDVIDNDKITDINTAYFESVLNGSQWLIGPLNKDDVQSLASQPVLPLPTIALNYADLPGADLQNADPANAERMGESPVQTPRDLYQYGLSAEDDARQIAERAWADGHRRALVMAPQGEWGERVYGAFRDHWLALGGDIAETRFYPRTNDYNPEVREMLNVDDSASRHQSIQSLVRLPVEFEPRPRQDADWLFLLALPEQARLIKPALAFNFAYDLPVYATSQVYSGTDNPDRDRDLNGIRFCDLPWLLGSTEIRSTLDEGLGHSSGSYSRLHAMGVDAYRLMERIRQLQALPDSRIYGATGVLTLDGNNRIHRTTECTEFSRGVPVRLTGVSEAPTDLEEDLKQDPEQSTDS